MADDLLALADLVKINSRDLADIDVTDLLDEAPLLAALAGAESSNGTVHKYTKQTGAPVVGFRAPNTGRDLDSSVDTEVTINLKLLDATSAIDVGIANAYKMGPQALIARETRRHLKAAFFKAEQQFVNGTGLDSDGFTGFIDAATIDELSDDMVIGGGGSTALTSVYLIRTNNDETDVTAVMGQDMNIDVGETTVQLIEDGSGKKFPAYVTPALGWLGLQIGSIHSIGRIANLDASSNSLDDDLLADALGEFPASKGPTLIVMNRRSRKQLQKSRTATNVTGAPAPTPTEYEGIPIITTDAILNDETEVS